MSTTQSHSSPFRFFRGNKKIDSIDKKDVRRSKSPPSLTTSKKNKSIPLSKKSKSTHTDLHYDAMDDDPESLIESLQALGDDQPKVARSIPKNSKPSRHADRSLKDCLYTQDVYDGMLSDSMKICDYLQSHLDECMETVRSRSPDTSSKMSSLENDHDSGRGRSSPSSPPSSRGPLKSCVQHDV